MAAPFLIQTIFILLMCVYIVIGSYSNLQINNTRSFGIDFANNTFLKDGKPFRYVSGSLHYSRVHPFYWKDRLLKLRASGLNVVQGYVPWNVHETKPGEFNWGGFSNLPKYLSLAQESDLLVLLRLGPYICGEWEFGGFPAWLLSEDPNIVLRTSDPSYMKYVDRWFTELLNKIKPFMYNNGGPIIMVQIENEYGSYFACDRSYPLALRDKVTSILGNDAVMYTTDGCNLKEVFCGHVDKVYTTVDFGAGTNPSQCFNAQRFYEPQGPLVNSEFYVGWLDHWGDPHATRNMTQVSKSLDAMLTLGANVNMYMFVGGTNFGFMNGANSNPYQAVPTSYDYDAAITEAGDITLKYFALRDIVSKYLPLPLPVPKNDIKANYGKVPMKFVSTVQDLLHILTPEGPFYSKHPIPMEDIQFYEGFILYRTKLTENLKDTITLNIATLRDRAMVMVDSVPLGVLDREGATSLPLSGLVGQILDILVENKGRIGFGPDMNFNNKGILSNVTLGKKVLTDWKIYPLHLDKINNTLTAYLQSMVSTSAPFFSADFKLMTPSLYVGALTTHSEMLDTFLDPQPWGKGQAFINSFNLGRYWPSRGPQVTLYVPGPEIYKQNHVFMFEVERAPCGKGEDCSVNFTDVPYIDAPNHPDKHGHILLDKKNQTLFRKKY